MVEITEGNLLEADVEALVNTVNTVGVMGKGIALQFRQAFPSVYDAYKRACDAGEVQPGRMLVAQTGQVSGPRLVINFPTKRHWKGKSRLGDIDAGLEDLVRVLEDWEVRSVAVPPLGCGNGGLDWDVVRPRIEQALEKVNAHVLLYQPSGAPDPRAQKTATPAPRMTRGRASLLLGLAGYRADPVAQITQLVVQKIAYLLQVRGEPLRLQFVQGKFGPYAEALNHVLQRMDGHFIRGYGDRTGVSDLELDPDAVDAARKFLADDPEAESRIGEVHALIDGFESPFGLELLTTVHWAATTGGASDADEAAAFVARWNPRKERVFTAQHVAAACERLGECGWLAGSAQ